MQFAQSSSLLILQRISGNQVLCFRTLTGTPLVFVIATAILRLGKVAKHAY